MADAGIIELQVKAAAQAVVVVLCIHHHGHKQSLAGRVGKRCGAQVELHLAVIAVGFVERIFGCDIECGAFGIEVEELFRAVNHGKCCFVNLLQIELYVANDGLIALGIQEPVGDLVDFHIGQFIQVGQVFGGVDDLRAGVCQIECGGSRVPVRTFHHGGGSLIVAHLQSGALVGLSLRGSHGCQCGNQQINFFHKQCVLCE